MLNKFAAPIAILSLTLGLAGCAPAATAPSKSPAASEAPAPEPTPSVEAVAEAIVFDATRVYLESADGVEIDSFDLYAEGEGARATEVFLDLLGPADTTKKLDEETFSRSGEELQWEGFSIRVWDDTAQFPVLSDLYFRAATDSVNGIAIRTGDDVAVGDALPDDADDVYYGDDGAFVHALQQEPVEVGGTGAVVRPDQSITDPTLFVTGVSENDVAMVLITPDSNIMLKK